MSDVSNRPEKDSQDSTPPSKSAVILLLGDIGDTTWRLFVPVIAATVLGIMADKYYDTTPWLMFLSISIGTVIAVLLIVQQLKRIK